MTTPDSLESSEVWLAQLLRPLQGSPTFERVQLYTARFTGGPKLSEYLADDKILATDKATVLDSLISILEAGDFSRLPEIVERAPDGTGTAVISEGGPCAPLKSGAVVVDLLPPGPLTRAEVRSIAREEAREVMADVMGKISRVLGHDNEPESDET